MSIVRYGAGILKWTKDELNVMDRKTQKIITMNRMYHPQSDTGRLYIPRMEDRRVKKKWKRSGPCDKLWLFQL